MPKSHEGNGLENLLKKKDLSPEVRTLATALHEVQQEVKELRERVDRHQHDSEIHHSHAHAHAHG